MNTTLAFADGSIVVAKYFDGTWRYGSKRKIAGRILSSDERVLSDGNLVRWDRSNAHCLIFERSGFKYAVQGYRAAGVTYQELVAVAASLRFLVA